MIFHPIPRYIVFTVVPATVSMGEFSMSFDDGIDDSEQFSHTGGHGDFEGFSGGD